MIGSKVDDIQASIKRSSQNLGSLYDVIDQLVDEVVRKRIKSAADDLSDRLVQLTKDVAGGVSLPGVIPSWMTRDEEYYRQAVGIEQEVASLWSEWSKSSGKPIPSSVKPPSTSLASSITGIAAAVAVVAVVVGVIYVVSKVVKK